MELTDPYRHMYLTDLQTLFSYFTLFSVPLPYPNGHYYLIFLFSAIFCLTSPAVPLTQVQKYKHRVSISCMQQRSEIRPNQYPLNPKV